jgi:hypothetical protein
MCHYSQLIATTMSLSRWPEFRNYQQKYLFDVEYQTLIRSCRAAWNWFYFKAISARRGLAWPGADSIHVEAPKVVGRSLRKNAGRRDRPGDGAGIRNHRNQLWRVATDTQNR